MYHTNRLFNGIMEDAEPTHDLSKTYLNIIAEMTTRSKISFHVRREQYVTKKPNKFIFNDGV